MKDGKTIVESALLLKPAEVEAALREYAQKYKLMPENGYGTKLECHNLRGRGAGETKKVKSPQFFFLKWKVAVDPDNS